MNTLQARNEAIIDAPVSTIWTIITDINALPKVNPGIITAKGRMDVLYETRTCEIMNRGKRGTMVEKLIEFIPNKQTVWTIESDTMGMKKMLHDTRFVLNLESVNEKQTRVISETYYRPANLLAKIMNKLKMKKMISKAQEQILANLQSLIAK